MFTSQLLHLKSHIQLPKSHIAIILLIYTALSLYQLNLPGLHYDEAFEAVPAVQLLYDQPVTAFRNSGLWLGGRLFPLMTQDYIGAINTYTTLPLIALLGPTPIALRLIPVLAGALTVWLVYALARALTGNSKVGLVAALFLAVDPTFIFWNRQGVFVTAVLAPIGLAAALSWLKRWQTGSRGWAVTGAFLLGLGLYAKLLFLWLIAALVGSVILLNLFRLKSWTMELWHTTNVREIGLMALAFLAGCWPLLLYNLQTGGTFINISQNAQTSYYGVDNAAIGPNLLTRLGQLGVTLNGGHLWYLGKVMQNWTGVILLGILLILVIITIRKNSTPLPTPLPPFKVALFPMLVIGLVILFSVATVSALWVTHFAILMPWPALALAVGGWYLSRLPLPIMPKLKQSALWGAVLLLTLTSLLTTLRYHRSLTESGGLSTHSDAVYDLSLWLADNARGPVIAMDWGLAAPVTYLTGGRVTPVEIFGYGWQPTPQLTDHLADIIAQREALYLWRAPDEIIFDRSREFKNLYRPLNLEENIEAAFYEHSGRPLLGVTRLVPKGAAENPPQ